MSLPTRPRALGGVRALALRLLGFALLAAVSAPRAEGQEDAERERAQARFAEATRGEYAARLELWHAYAAHQAIWSLLRDPAEQDLLDRAAEVLSNAYAEALAAGGRPKREEIEARLAGALAALPADEPWARFPAAHADLAAWAVAALRAARTEDAATEIRDQLARSYRSQDDWVSCWNRQIAPRCGAARRYADARSERSEASLELQRRIDPVASHPAAKDTPPGMVLVPGGSYNVGPAKGWTTGKTVESRTIDLRSYYIDRFEVTNAEYREFLGALPKRKAEPLYPSTWLRGAEGEAPKIPEGREDHPVTGVDLVAAMAYADWKGKRLPTELEWEVAAAGPLASEYPWGASYGKDQANDLDGGRLETAAGGTYAADLSAFGCFDMAGNVCEWTLSLPTGDTISRAPRPGELLNVITRGGSFLADDPVESGSTTYRWPQPARGTQRSDLGFRCAKDARSR